MKARMTPEDFPLTIPQPLADALAASLGERTHLRLRTAVRDLQAWLADEGVGYADVSGDELNFFQRIAGLPRRRDCDPTNLPQAFEGFVDDERLEALESGAVPTDEEWARCVRVSIESNLERSSEGASIAFSITPIANAPRPTYVLCQWQGFGWTEVECLGAFPSREEAFDYLRTIGIVEADFDADPEREVARAIGVLRRAR
jgi:hypothetical protein